MWGKIKNKNKTTEHTVFRTYDLKLKHAKTCPSVRMLIFARLLFLKDSVQKIRL
jgi:hypothetical protein